ncbi:hypothetical protein Bbelb_365710 [Branchiostoma belcheri]|nr:hypothetical protein Bbelb_365710 [Branchiostoma belcheri]
MPEDEMEMLLDVIKQTNILFNYTLLQEDPSKTTICYKMRGQVCPVADLLQRALPKVKNIFLYRDLVGTVDSYAHVMAGGRYWKYEELCKYKEEMVIKVMDSLGIKCVDENAKVKIRKVFGVNSQAGHSLGSMMKASREQGQQASRSGCFQPMLGLGAHNNVAITTQGSDMHFTSSTVLLFSQTEVKGDKDDADFGVLELR